MSMNACSAVQNIVSGYAVAFTRFQGSNGNSHAVIGQGEGDMQGASAAIAADRQLGLSHGRAAEAANLVNSRSGR
jgi:hypothetical protein